MKISFVLAAPGLAGGIKSNRLIAEALSRRGHDVSIYYSTGAPKRPGRWGIRSFIRRLTTWGNRPVGPGPGHLKSSSIPIHPVAARPIRSVDVSDADVTIATWWETAEWIAKWPASKGMKCYFIRHYETWGGPEDRVHATYRLPFRKLVIARWLQRLMEDKFHDSNSILVPNGVDRNQFVAEQRRRNATPVIGFMYGEAGWKGAKTAFEAIRIVQKQYPGVKVVSFGATAPESMAALPRNWQFIRQPQQNEIPEIYAQTDCWVVPSTSEGFGMPGIEAAACRCPLVSTRCGGPEDYVQEGVNGYLVPISDPTAMAEAITKVLNLSDEEWKQMSDASYRISLEFDWDRSAEILESTLLADLARSTEGEQVLAGKPK